MSRSKEAEWLDVFVAFDPIEVGVVQGILEAEELEVRVRDMTVTPYPVRIGPLGEKRIAVRAVCAAQAVASLRTALTDGYLTRDGILEPPARG